MNILNKLTIKNLKLNKKRTIVTIVGIILATALICAVAGMATSTQQTLINDAILSNGNQHITIENVENDDLKYFTNNRNVKSYYLAENLGYAILDNSQNELKPYLYIKAYNKYGIEEAGYKLTEGRTPENSNEIVLSETVITNGKVPLKVGDMLTLNIGERKYESDGTILNQSNPYNPEEKEVINNGVTKTYTIVGFIERTNYGREGVYSPGYTALTYTDIFDGDKTEISLFFNKPSYYKEMETILKKEFSDYNYYFNDDLLRWQLVGIRSDTLITLLAVAAVVIIIIILTSVFVIKNSFSISINEKTKQYGMLSSIGATSKQIKKNVLYEGFILGIIGIPIGVLSGMFADFVLVKTINYLLADALNDIVFVYKVPWIPIFMTIILAIMTIYLSVISSARRASKISPIEAIRNNKEIKISSKKIKSPKIISKIFKTGGVIAYKNLKRSKKKYRTTVISLVVSVSVFIALSSFITFGFKMSGIYYEELNYNVAVVSEGTNEEILNNYEDILAMDNIESYNLMQENVLFVDMKDITDDEAFFSMFGSDKEETLDTVLGINIISLSNEEYKRFVNDIGGNIEKYQNGAILIDENYHYIEDKYVYYNIYDLKVGDIFNGYIEIDKDNKKNISIPIVVRTSKRPMGLEKTYSESGYLIVNQEYLENIGVKWVGTLYINSSNPTELCNNIDTYKLNNPSLSISYNNIDKVAKQENSFVLLIAIFLYGFIIVISLIGITNIFNTITTNMSLRKKEFAMLKSIGMTSSEFKRMINLESLFYGTKSLLIGIPIGIMGSMLIYLAFVNGADMPYIFPIKAIIIAVIGVFILVFVIMHYSIKKTNRQNIIETIRNDNI